jgi:hypothetical protein
MIDEDGLGDPDAGLETHLSDDSDSDDEKPFKYEQKEYTKTQFHAIKEVIKRIMADHGETDVLYDSKYCDLKAFIPSSAHEERETLR